MIAARRLRKARLSSLSNGRGRVAAPTLTASLDHGLANLPADVPATRGGSDITRRPRPFLSLRPGIASMKITTPLILTVTLVLAVGSVQAQPGRAPASTPHETLVLMPGIDAAQAAEIRRIEAGRRDAHDQLAIRQRGEHARIDDETERKLRQRLGDDGYRDYIRWKSGSMRSPRPGHAAGDGPAARGGRPDATTPDAGRPPES